MDMLLNNDNLNAKKILMLFLRWSQIAIDKTKNIIRDKNNNTWLSKRLVKFFLKHAMYKVNGRLAASIPNIIISSVKKLL